TYSYRVAAVDNAGNIGALSSQVSKTTAASTSSTDRTPPAQVTGLVITTVSSSQLNLAWTKVSASDFNHYNIYRGTSPNFAVSLGITPPTGTSTPNSYSSTGLNPSTTYYYKVAAVDNAGNIGLLSSEKSAVTAAATTSTGNVYDDFQASTYKLTDGQKSPNGKWLSKWNAGGEMGVKTENGNNVFYGFPQTATSSGQTYSSFALSTQKFSDMTLELDMKTYKQLRQNSAPNTWETTWVMWRWTDLFHHYYFVIKTNGIEFGKKDTSCSCEQQVFLKTGPSPTLKINTWNHVKISSIGKQTTIWLDGVKVVDMDDPSYSSTASMYRTIQRRCFNCL
ncbi:MAG: family 16 glycoside hydrolase, partial [Nitrososphaeraceae archaeon]